MHSTSDEKISVTHSDCRKSSFEMVTSVSELLYSSHHSPCNKILSILLVPIFIECCRRKKHRLIDSIQSEKGSAIILDRALNHGRFDLKV